MTTTIDEARAPSGAVPSPSVSAFAPAPAAGRRRAAASFGQASLWFLRQVMPYPSSYNTAVQLRLEGELDAAPLMAAVREVARRHESFRTTFTILDGSVAALVWDDLPVDARSVDLTSDPSPEAAAQSLARAAGADPFDLDRGPLLRVRLLRVGPRTHLLVVVIDHIVADGTSLGVLWRELEALYPACREGKPSPLPPPAKQFTACAEEQARWLSTPAFAKQLKYWTSHLAGATSCDMPTDRPRPPIRSYRGDLAIASVPAPIVARLRAICRDADVSLFASLLAALDVLLARYSGQRDVVVMVPMAGRQRFGAEAVVGYFANMVVLRTEVPDDLAFGELVQRVNKEIMAGVFRQDVPFAKVIEALRPDRSLGDDPLGRIALSFFSVPGSTLNLPGVRSTYGEIPNGGAKFDLSLIISERADDLTISAEYNLDIFDAPTVERLLGGLRVLLEGVAARPSQRLRDLPILPAEEAQRLLALGRGGASFPVDACLHELFQAQAARTPGAPAVRFEGRTLTYRELDARADQLARALRRRGVGPETLVGLAIDRGVDLVVGILGILAAGGAYLPLDPEYPRSRLAFMIDDARVPVVVTLAHHGHLFEPGLDLLRLDADADAIALESGDGGDLQPLARPDSLAYVIYTSGSTGNPKGVMVEHRHVVRLMYATDAWYRFDARDVWTMFHSYAFDFSVWEMWGALLYGGLLVVVPRSVARSPDAFYRLLVDQRVTVLNQTPSAFRQLVEADGDADAATRSALALRTVIFGGEALRVSDLEPFWQRHGDERPLLVNMYGITETTVHVTYRPLRRADLERPWASVIGEPIPDLSVHVLDAQRRPVPVGVPGELYVGGAGVARGYLRRPELTSERFIDDALGAGGAGGAGPGGRLYRTGDRARRLDNGDVEYLGRVDHQVKIRGYRIELGEIEARLSEHPTVRAAAVIAREDRPGDVRLVAYVVPASDGGVDAGALRAFLAERLIEPMVPAAFVSLTALPLTSNGKLDRRALPAPDDRAVAQGSFVAPRTQAEELLAGIWAEVLGLDRVGVADDFFALGGHSLMALKLFNRIEKAFGVTLPIASLFQARTVEALAHLLRRDGWKPSWSSLVPIQPEGRRRPFFCVHAVGGNVLNYRLLSDHLGKDVPFYGLQSRGLGGDEAPHTTVAEMAAAYIDEMRQERPRGPYQIGGGSSGGVIAYEMAQQLHAAGERVSALVFFDTYILGAPPPRLVEARAASPLHARALLLDHHLGHLLLRTPREGFDYLVARMRSRLGGAVGPVAQAIQAANPAVRHVIEANLRAVSQYVPRPYPGSAVMLLSRDEPGRAFYDGRLAWADLVQEGLVLRFIPGDHENMLDEPTVSGVAAILDRCLER